MSFYKPLDKLMDSQDTSCNLRTGVVGWENIAWSKIWVGAGHIDLLLPGFHTCVSKTVEDGAEAEKSKTPVHCTSLLAAVVAVVVFALHSNTVGYRVAYSKMDKLQDRPLRVVAGGVPVELLVPL
jgi:hypothetical protein